MNHNKLLEIASFSPRSLQFPNAWVGHLPFAAWIIKEVSPKIFVELGTHSGNSYFAFCQSVAEDGLLTKCYAVDTWQGDMHAEYYGNEIFTGVNAYNQEHYAEFSRLLRMTFDDAVTYFANESIQLLHIDGLHTYDAVRHDFETWLPKLAPGAVVIFHDTNVRERGFGVWKLWEELQKRYPNNLEFIHSHGLGVLQLNNAPADKKVEWLQPDTHIRQQLKNYFAALGSRQVERYELSWSYKPQIAKLSQAVHDKEVHIGNLDRALRERDGQIAGLDQAVHDKEVHIGNIEYLLREQDGQITSLNQAVAERDGQISNLNQAVSERNGQIAGLSQATVERDSVIRHILTSTSWRITRPLRAVKSLFWRNGGSMNAQETSSKHFDAAWYLKRNPDVVMSGMDAYEHYVLFGRNEGRLPRPDSLIKRNIKRLQVVFSLIPSFMNSAGGFFPAVIKVMKVLKQEGWSGLARRILILRERSGASVEQNRYAVASYANYIAAMEPNDEDLKAMGAAVTCLGYRPKFSIVVPVYNVEAKWLTCFIQSVLAQVYPDWELCIADDHSTLSHVKPLLESFAAKDPRIRLVFRNVNGHISAATNSALELATGDFVCLMDNDDEIAPHALYEFASLLNRDESIDMIYSDEDKLDIEGNRYEPFFKPDWSPEALEGCMYTAHFACYRMSFVREVGGFRSNFNGAQDYDFVLRFTERAAKIAHIPKVLYHWRAIPGSTAASMDAKDYVLDAAIRALAERAERVAGGGEASMSSYSGSFDLRYRINGSPLVSIVIPSAGRMAHVRGKDVDLLAQVVSSICEHTTYRNFEIIVVDNNDLRPETLEAIKPYICRFVHFEGELNIATKMNLGAREARGEYLLFMNDDIEVITPDWMECLLQLCQRKGVGVVGAKLHYENNSLQHVGVAFWNGLPDHIHRAFPGTHPGHFFSSVANRNYLAVTGAVLMTKRELFKAVGGFDEEFAINYNDIDYCLKVFREGFRIVFAAGAQLYHYESVSREAVVSPEEIELFQQKWMDVVSYDPYCSAFFDNHPPVFALRHEWSNSSILDAVKSPIVSQLANA